MRDDDDGPRPRDLSRATQKFDTFHKRDPKTIGEFAPSFVIPTSMAFAGESVQVSYRSDKWGKSPTNYIHHSDCSCGHEREEHDEGTSGCDSWGCNCRSFKSNVGMYLSRGTVRSKVPSNIRGAQTLIRLGSCLDFDYIDHRGEVVHRKCSGELFCTPNGKALLIITGKKTLVAMVWGGKLDVRDVGIVG